MMELGVWIGMAIGLFTGILIGYCHGVDAERSRR